MGWDCPYCGFAMKRETRNHRVTYGGRSCAVLLPGWYCDPCKESIHDTADCAPSDAALDELKRQDAAQLRQDGPGAALAGSEQPSSQA